jgi:hypothetical protein
VLISEEPAIREIKEKSLAAKAWRLHVEPAEVGPGKEDEAEYMKLEVDGDEVSEGVSAALREADVFREVLTGEPDGADLSLHLEVLSARARFAGSNGNRVPWFLVWSLLSSVAASFIADEEYEGELEAEVSLLESGKEQPLWHDVVKVSFAGSLDHWQRGISIWDLMAPGPFLADANPGKLSSCLVPHLLRKLELELARRFSAEVPPPTMDVLISVGGVPEMEGIEKKKIMAAEDASKFQRAFEARTGKFETRLLVKSGATATGFRKALEAQSARRDVETRDFILYIAGVGTLVKSGENELEAAVVFADGTTIPVAEIAALVGKVRASSRCVVLDAGFSGKGGRCLDNVLANGKTVLPFPKGKETPAILAACGPDGTTHDSPELKGGVFTHFIVEIMKPEKRGDGQVTCVEAFRGLAWKVLRESRFLGGTSQPLLSGDGVLFRSPLAEEEPKKPDKDETEEEKAEN